MTDRQCPSCGGFCGRGGCERENVKPVGIVRTVGGYPDDSTHTVEWLVKHKELRDGDKLYASPQTRNPESEQKPVAVVTSQTGDPVTMSWHHEPALPIGTKLYAAPPARKPLTDNTLWEMWVESPSDVMRFARAIERAHGIGSD